jgi:hypothetical protein
MGIRTFTKILVLRINDTARLALTATNARSDRICRTKSLANLTEKHETCGYFHFNIRCYTSAIQDFISERSAKIDHPGSGQVSFYWGRPKAVRLE